MLESVTSVPSASFSFSGSSDSAYVATVDADASQGSSLVSIATVSCRLALVPRSAINVLLPLVPLVPFIMALMALSMGGHFVHLKHSDWDKWGYWLESFTTNNATSAACYVARGYACDRITASASIRSSNLS